MYIHIYSNNIFGFIYRSADGITIEHIFRDDEQSFLFTKQQNLIARKLTHYSY